MFVLSCVGSSLATLSMLATGWSLVQRVLPTVYKCKITEPHKEEAKARYGLQRHIKRRGGASRVCPSDHTFLLENRWTDYDKIWYGLYCFES
jgi:hypothetical protein